jgi:hypothetical protein
VVPVLDRYGRRRTRRFRAPDTAPAPCALMPDRVHSAAWRGRLRGHDRHCVPDGGFRRCAGQLGCGWTGSGCRRIWCVVRTAWARTARAVVKDAAVASSRAVRVRARAWEQYTPGLFTGAYRRAVLPGRPPVAGPGQLEDAGRAADALHAQASAEAPASGAQVVDDGGHGLAGALGGCEAVQIGGEAGQGLVGGHGELLQEARSPRPVAGGGGGCSW